MRRVFFEIVNVRAFLRSSSNRKPLGGKIGKATSVRSLEIFSDETCSSSILELHRMRIRLQQNIATMAAPTLTWPSRPDFLLVIIVILFLMNERLKLCTNCCELLLINCLKSKVWYSTTE